MLSPAKTCPRVKSMQTICIAELQESLLHVRDFHQISSMTYLREGLPRMLSPARTCPKVKRLLLMEPVSLKATSPSFPVDCTHKRVAFGTVTLYCYDSDSKITVI